MDWEERSRLRWVIALSILLSVLLLFLLARQWVKHERALFGLATAAAERVLLTKSLEELPEYLRVDSVSAWEGDADSRKGGFVLRRTDRIPLWQGWECIFDFPETGRRVLFDVFLRNNEQVLIRSYRSLSIQELEEREERGGDE